MHIENFITADLAFAAFAINHFGDGGHPEAKADASLRFFGRQYATECVAKAIKSGKVTIEAKAAGERIIGALMLVDLYNDAGVLESTCELAECFPGDAASTEAARKDIEKNGEHWVGGGAAPIFHIKRHGD